MGNNWRNYFKNWVSVLGLVILLLLTITALIGPVFAPFDPEDLEIGRRATAPNAIYWVGTDELGRDVFSRAVTAVRVSLLVGIIAATVSTIVGILVGSLAGFFGGWIFLVRAGFWRLDFTEGWVFSVRAGYWRLDLLEGGFFN